MNTLPQELTDRIQAIYPDQYEKILEAYSTDRIGSFRVNTLTSTVDEVLKECEEKNIEVQKMDTMEGVFTFDKKNFEYAIKGTDAFYKGKIYLQSLASMLPVLALDPQKHTKILDICAAPGGKTTQMAVITENRSDIVALEKNKMRCDKLEYNCKLQGATRVKTRKIDALKYLAEGKHNVFDAIILDVPCSAEGRINSTNEKTYGFWTLENIEKKAELQKKLFAAAIKKLKKGGVLIYSTCTLAPEENEAVVSRMLSRNKKCSLEKVELFENENFLLGLREFQGAKFSEGMENTLRVLPSDMMEGFFIAKIRKG